MLPPEDAKHVPGRFYCTFKVHKEHKHGETPPLRGIVSCYGTLSERNALYGENKIKKIMEKHIAHILKTLLTFSDTY